MHANRRLDNYRATMDDFYARISPQDWYHDLSDQEDNEENRLSTRDTNANAENQSGVENRPRRGRIEETILRVTGSSDMDLSAKQEFHQTWLESKMATFGCAVAAQESWCASSTFR